MYQREVWILSFKSFLKEYLDEVFYIAYFWFFIQLYNGALIAEGSRAGFMATFAGINIILIVVGLLTMMIPVVGMWGLIPAGVGVLGMAGIGANIGSSLGGILGNSSMILYIGGAILLLLILKGRGNARKGVEYIVINQPAPPVQGGPR